MWVCVVCVCVRAVDGTGHTGSHKHQSTRNSHTTLKQRPNKQHTRKWRPPAPVGTALPDAVSIPLSGSQHTHTKKERKRKRKRRRETLASLPFSTRRYTVSIHFSLFSLIACEGKEENVRHKNTRVGKRSDRRQATQKVSHDFLSVLC